MFPCLRVKPSFRWRLVSLLNEALAEEKNTGAALTQLADAQANEHAQQVAE